MKKKVDTDGSRKDAEGSRKDAEGSRKDAEGSRKDVEGPKKDAEGSKKDAEGSKKVVSKMGICAGARFYMQKQNMDALVQPSRQINKSKLQLRYLKV